MQHPKVKSNKIHHINILNIPNNLRLSQRSHEMASRQPVPEEHNFLLPFALIG
jgi:hypothetical protein